MPTEPLKHLLDRDPKNLPTFIHQIMSPVLKETINYATNLYERCRTSEDGKPDEAYPPLASYLHIIQMTDSIEVLISNGCVEPAALLLRSSFEARLAIGYILEKDTKRRSISWMVNIIVERIKQLEKIERSVPKDKEINNSLDIIGIGGTGDSPTTNLTGDIYKLKESLKQPGYSEAYVEYIALAKNRQYPNWYSFFGGPNKIKGLAKYLKQDFIYNNLYATWSKMAHFNDAEHLTFPLENGTSVVSPIRNSMKSIYIGLMAISFLLEVMPLMINKYRPYESTSFSKWMEKELQDKLIILVGLEDRQTKWFQEKFVQQRPP